MANEVIKHLVELLNFQKIGMIIKIFFKVTARAITYYLDVSNECTRRITQVDGAVKAICNRLIMAEMTNRTSKDLGTEKFLI